MFFRVKRGYEVFYVSLEIRVDSEITLDIDRMVPQQESVNFKNNHTLQMSVVPHFGSDSYGQMNFTAKWGYSGILGPFNVDVLTQK